VHIKVYVSTLQLGQHFLTNLRDSLTRFWYLFIASLDKVEIEPDQRPFRVRNPEFLPSEGLMECDVPTLALNGIKESWSCYYPEDVWNAMCQHSQSTGVRNHPEDVWNAMCQHSHCMG
jgi:hypothetical protein